MPAFPPGYHIEPGSRVEDDDGIEYDALYDGTPLSQQRGDEEYTTLDVAIGALTAAEYNEIRVFIRVNKGRKDITWTIDGIDYIGEIRGPIRRSFQGALRRISFRYYAKEV